MELWNETRNTLVASRVCIARMPWTRTLGWMGRSTIALDEALVLKHCHAIHTWGMRSNIDVVFLSATYEIVAFHENVAPMRNIVQCRTAAHTVELHAGRIRATMTQLGDQVRLA